MNRAGTARRSAAATAGVGAQRPRFTIVTAAYNVSRYLDEYIGSIEGQSIDGAQLQVVVVDDGSTDDTLSALQAWRQRSSLDLTVLTKANGGQASARNLGLTHASGEWVTFLDPDDVVDPNYFETVHRFLVDHPDTQMLTTNRLLFHEDRGLLSHSHPLRKMFDGGSVLVDCATTGSHFPGSAPASFVQLDIVRSHGLAFDERIWPNFEDGHFCASYCLALDRPLVGFVTTAFYVYRKRGDNSSTLQTNDAQPRRFTDVPKYGYLDVLEKAKRTKGAVPRWLQSMIVYELSWYFSRDEQPFSASTAAIDGVGATFVEHLGRIGTYLDPSAFAEFGHRHWKTVWTEFIHHAASGATWHSPYVAIGQYDADAGEVRCVYRFTGERPIERFLIDGHEVAPLHAKDRLIRLFDSRLHYERIVWVAVGETLEVRLDDVSTPITRAAAIPAVAGPVTFEELLAPRPQEAAQRRRVRRQRVRRKAGSVVRRLYRPAVPVISRVVYSRRSVTAHTVRVARRAPRAELAMIRWFIESPHARRLGARPPVPATPRVPAPIARLVPGRSHAEYDGAWVLMDRVHDANDSAEHLFRHLRTNRPDINAWFVVEADTPDWHRLAADGVGRVVAHGSSEWIALMQRCEILISSHADAPIVTPVQMRGRMPWPPKWKFVFLQHGVTKDDLSLWLNAKPIRLFVASTPDEYDSICGDGTQYRQTTRETVLSGMPRFDALFDAARGLGEAPPDLVIVAPTWRQWLNKAALAMSQRRQMVDGFAETEFVQRWMAILEDPRVHEAVAEHGYRLTFMPHPNLMASMQTVPLPAGVELLGFDDPDLHRTFARAAMLVTDYSSMSFNVAFLGRSIAYYQFDRERMLNGGHVGRRGYFDYETKGFGPVLLEHEDVVAEMVASITRRCEPLADYRRRMDAAFVIRDGRCCERLTAAIEQL